MLIGERNTLTVTRRTDLGLFLDGEGAGDVLLPSREAPAQAKPGDQLDVFVYIDAKGHCVATTKHPLASVGDVAYLRINDVNDAGAFLDWGLPKDLLLPYNELPRDVRRFIEPGASVLVMVFVDDQNRLAASARLDDFISPVAQDLATGDTVTIIADHKTEIGVRVIVNNRYWGLIYNDELYQPLPKGERRQAYVLKLRSDGRLDITLQPPGGARRNAASEAILKRLQQEGGFMAVSDKSSPDLIYKVFGVSKKVFKQAIGGLYKERLISIGSDGIRLTK